MGKEQLFTQMMPEIQVLSLLWPVWGWLGLRASLQNCWVKGIQGRVALFQEG